METKTLKLQVKELPGQRKIKLVEMAGALDALTVPEAEKVFNSLINEGGDGIIVDCSKLTFINTVGVVLFMKYHIRCKRRDRDFKIANPNKSIYEIMDISGALKLLEVYKSQEEAINNLK